jgi:hypothetical protein
MLTATMAIVMVSALYAAVAMPARAAEWLVNGSPVTGNVGVDSQSEGRSILWEDMGTGVDILFEATGKGTIGPGGKSEETERSFFNPEIMAGEATCKKLLAIRAVDLPWSGQLEAGIRDKITGGSSGVPGMLVECEGPFGIKVDDTCTSNTFSSAMTNEANGTVDFFVDGAAGNQGDCTVGGGGQWLLEGLMWLLTVSGVPLAVS